MSNATQLQDYSELPEIEARFRDCENRIAYQFANRSLLKAALTHASSAEHRLASNERLEFLGDAILGAIVCESLFHRFPEHHEGELTRIKSIVVSRATCAKLARRLGMQELLILGKGMATHPTVPASLLADVFEALLGAIFLDGGIEAARRFTLRHVEPEIERAATSTAGGNYKSLLQERAQRENGATPVYRLLDEKGPDHSKCFKIAAQIGTTAFPPAWGSNKKEAEQRAALNALCDLQGEDLPHPTE